jgi:DNA-binding response OmpR family regulator
MTSGPYTVVLVDDNDDHCMLIEETLVTQAFAGEVIRFRDAESALAGLLEPRAARGGQGGRPPDFIFLDIRLPGMSGIELLRQLKNHAATRAIPTLMLTTSERGEEIRASYDAGACGYIVKPVDVTVLADKIRALREYWGPVSEVPTFQPPAGPPAAGR